MSQAQKDKAAAMVAAALAACGGGPFEDPDLPPSKASLWLDGESPAATLGIADPVASWRRMEGGRLFLNDWDTEGVVRGALPNHWLAAASNVVAGDQDIVAKCFVDATHGNSHGFYVVRFFVESASSGDEWQVVLVDDRLPCDAAGTPCFARCPTPTVLWLAILEKAYAKLRGCYEATVNGTVEDGLVLLTGGMARSIEAAAAEPDALWQEMMGAWTGGAVIGCRAGVAGNGAAGDPAAVGLQPAETYCAVTGGEMPPGKMVRLRAFHGSPEWRGRWADDDPGWTSQLRNLMRFSRDAGDGSFWMDFGDFRRWFSLVYTCRMADDKWTKMTARSQWVDASAGGGPNFVSWRHNPQWLLRVPRPTRLTLSMTLPQPDGDAAPAQPFAIGACLFRGNDAPDGVRRKLVLVEGDVVFSSEPRFSRRFIQEVSLPGSEVPYLLMPFTHEPGLESPFTLVVQTDDRDEDGVADITMEPVQPATDWRTGSASGSWDASGGGGAPGMPTFGANPQLELRLTGGGGRFFIFAESVGVHQDGRLQEGLQQAEFPSIGVALHCASPALTQQVEAAPRDGVVLQCALEPSDAPYVISPYLQHPAVAVASHPGLGYRIAVYSDVEFEFGDASAVCEPADTGPPVCGGHNCWCCIHDAKFAQRRTTQRSKCPFYDIYERLDKIEQGVDRHLSLMALMG